MLIAGGVDMVQVREHVLSKTSPGIVTSEVSCCEPKEGKISVGEFPQRAIAKKPRKQENKKK